VEVAKALGGSFKLVTLAPRTVSEMIQLLKETQKNGDTNKLKGTNEHAKHKPRLNMQKNTLGPTGLYELVLVAVHMENFQCTANMPGTTSTALPSFSHDQHHETDAATGQTEGGGDKTPCTSRHVLPPSYICHFYRTALLYSALCGSSISSSVWRLTLFYDLE